MKKKSLYAAERDTDENRRRRADFLETIRATPAEKLIFLDESGVKLGMTRLYAAPAVVCASQKPRHRALEDSHHHRRHEHARHGRHHDHPRGHRIERYFSPTSIRSLPEAVAGDVVVMDNLSSHKVDGVRSESRHSRNAALPATILARSQSHRESMVQDETAPARVKSRTEQALDQAIAEALPAITSANARAWFRLCNYRYSYHECALALGRPSGTMCRSASEG